MRLMKEERGVIAAVIQLAVIDFKAPSFKRTPKNSEAIARQKRDRASADRFFFGEASIFEWMANSIDLDPEAVREKLGPERVAGCNRDE